MSRISKSAFRMAMLAAMLALIAPALPAANQAPGETDPARGKIASASSPSTGFAERDPRYRLSLSDELEIEFRFTPEFNQQLKVQPDGFVSLKDVGDVKVVGMTIDEVRQTIIDKYDSILHDPVVTVKLLEFNKPYFIVGGEVANPGKFDLTGDLTLSDAIAMAGGFASGAKSSDVLVFRRVSQDMVEVKRINVKQIMSGNPAEDLQLKPSDSVLVPRSTIGKIDRFLTVTRMGFYFPIPGL